MLPPVANRSRTNRQMHPRMPARCHPLRANSPRATFKTSNSPNNALIEKHGLSERDQTSGILKMVTKTPQFHLDQYIPYLLHQAHRGIYNIFNTELQNRDLQLSEWRILSVLMSRKSLRMSELATATGIEPPTLARLIGNMEARRWVVRKNSETDRRAINVRITPNGFDIANSIVPFAQEVNQRATNGLTNDETEFLRRLLTRVMKNLGTVPTDDPSSKKSD